VAEIPDLVESAVPAEEGKRDLESFACDPAVQQSVLALFKQAGARVVVFLRQDQAPQGSGWEQVPETDMWILRL
jgi:hypothetical protein